MTSTKKLFFSMALALILSVPVMTTTHEAMHLLINVLRGDTIDQFCLLGDDKGAGGWVLVSTYHPMTTDQAEFLPTITGFACAMVFEVVMLYVFTHLKWDSGAEWLGSEEDDDELV